jgi:hypothetical protein
MACMFVYLGSFWYFVALGVETCALVWIDSPE